MRFVSLSLFILPAAAETKLTEEKTFSLFPHFCVKVIDDMRTMLSPTTTISSRCSERGTTRQKSLASKSSKPSRSSSSSSHRSLCNRNVRGVFHHHFRVRKTRHETNAAFMNAKNNSAKNNETTNTWERKRREKAKKSDLNEDDASPNSFLNRLRPPNPRRRQQQQQGKVAKGEVSCMERGNATVRAAKTFASENEKLALFVFVIQAVYIVVKTTK